MKSSIRLFRIAGFNIGINYTWFFIVLLLTWSLAQGYFPQLYPGWTTASYWIIGTLAAVLLFVSVLIHELAHSIVARSRGMSVSSITLFIFGGVSNLEEEPKQPGIEFVMAIIGPLTSLVLAGIFWGIARISEPGSMLEALTGYLALLNLVLGIFNLLPGFPLDGGRVFRSIIWRSTGSLSKATNVATFAGQLFGWALITFGFFQLLTGNITGGLWTAFIGWFLNSAADASRKDVSLRERLSAIKVRDVMISDVETIAPDVSVEHAVTGMLSRKFGRAIPVVQNNRLIGIVTMTDIKGLSQDEWAATRVEQIMTGNPLYTITPEDTVDNALSLIAARDVNQVIVSREGQFIGILRRADIINYLQLRLELGKKV